MTEPRRAGTRSHEVRFHGRGGQGVVTSAELLSAAAFAQGLAAQAIPSFGSERTGAPVVAFCRIAQDPIRAHDPVDEPDVVVVSDPTMLHIGGILDGLRPHGLLLVNSSHQPDELSLPAQTVRSVRVVTIPATALARDRLGRALPNTALLGALTALTDTVSLSALQRAVRDRFPGDIGADNAALAGDGYREAQDAPHKTEVERRAEAG